MSPLPGSHFLQEKAGSKGWRDPICRPLVGKLSLSNSGQGSPLVTALGGGVRRSLLILFWNEVQSSHSPLCKGSGNQQTAHSPLSPTVYLFTSDLCPLASGRRTACERGRCVQAKLCPHRVAAFPALWHIEGLPSPFPRPWFQHLPKETETQGTRLADTRIQRGLHNSGIYWFLIDLQVIQWYIKIERA